MSRTSLFTVLFTLFFPIFLWGQQTIVTGKVTDGDSSEPLAFASVIFTNTTIGVTTDVDGQYELKTDDLNLKEITFSYLGYEPKTIKINPGKENEKNVKLKEVKLELDVVEVRAKRRTPKDTAAIVLYKNVVANKYRNDPSQYDFYEYLEYSKTEFGLYGLTDKFKESKLMSRFEFLLDNVDTLDNGVEVLPVLLKETSKQKYYRKSPNKEKTILLGNQFSGVENISVSDLVDYNFEPIQIYENLIIINGKPLMSPFADNARFSYKYFLTDTADFDGLTCYKLEFTGRGNADAAFTGHAWIHDSTFAIQAIKLTVLGNSSINFVSDFITEQKFKLIDGKYWFKDYEFMQTQYNLFKKKGDEKQSFLVRKSEQRTNLGVNEEIPDELLDGEPDIVEEGAREQDKAFWDSVRTGGFNQREENIFKAVDSLQNTRFYKSLRWLTYMISSGWMDAKYVEFGKFYQLYSWNDVEGGRFRLTMRTRPELSKRIQFTPHFAYGLKDETWKYGLEVRSHLRRKNEKWHMIGAEHHYDMSQAIAANPILRPSPTAYDNIGLSILRTSPLDDLFLMRYSALWYEREWVKGLNTRLSFEHKIHESVPTGKIFTTSDATTGDTTTIEKFTTSVATFNLVWGKKLKFYDANFRRFPITTRNPVFSFDYSFGIKGLFNADYGYHALKIGVGQRLPGPIGYTVYSIEAGGLFGTAPYTELTNHIGNETFLYSKYSYQAMNEGEFMSDLYARIWMVHHFDGFIFDKIPGINKLQLRSLIGARALYGQVADKNKNVIDLPNGLGPLDGFYAEVGVGLENILKVIRVDFWFRMTQRDKADINKWSFKLYFAPNF